MANNIHIVDVLTELHSGRDPRDRGFVVYGRDETIVDEETFLTQYSKELGVDEDGNAIDGADPDVSWSDVKTKWDEMEAEYDAQAYARNRKKEYPTIEELTIALYDTDDKAALETKRAAVKTKWPKDNSGPVK